MIAKGDYSYELNIPIPFALVSQDEANNRLQIMPGYWFMYNMYALERNSWKYNDRDNRTEKIQYLENDYLAPDSINEMIQALYLMELFVGRAFLKNENTEGVHKDAESAEKGRQLLMQHAPEINDLQVLADGLENSKRNTIILKVQGAYDSFREMILFYGIDQMLNLIESQQINSREELFNAIPSDISLGEWVNVGGQLILKTNLEQLKNDIKNNSIQSWDGVHDFYEKQTNDYLKQKLQHGLAALQKLLRINIKELTGLQVSALFDKALETRKKILASITQSREKDYTNPFRKMIYDSPGEMEQVLGSLADNSFIQLKNNEIKNYSGRIAKAKEKLN